MPSPSVGAGFARGLLNLAASKGADRAVLLDAAGIDPAVLADGDNRVPFAKYVALMRAAKRLAGDAALSLHYGEAVNVAEVSIAGLIPQASATMAEAFVQTNRYVRLVVDVAGVAVGDRFTLKGRRGGLWMVDTRENPNDFPELTESAFAQMVCSTRAFGDTPMVLEVNVTHPDPGYRAEYERILGAPVKFDADWNAMRIDPVWTTHKVARLPSYVFGVLSERADALMAELERSTSMRGQVERLLMPILHTGEASVEKIAAQLGLSRQTLFRRLRTEGATFAKVLDELRHRLAVQYLTGGKASVNQTAYLVGFSEPAAFSRAFKRWTGQSPRELRSASGRAPYSSERPAPHVPRSRGV